MPILARYQFTTGFRRDLMAGIPVVAVALAVAVAYAQLAGFNPVVGFYSSILPLVAYVILVASRQLLVNLDAATRAMRRRHRGYPAETGWKGSCDFGASSLGAAAPGLAPFFP